MNDNSDDSILARAKPEGFVCRAREKEIIERHAGGESAAQGLIVLSAAGEATGATEILRQTYDRIFSAQKTLPFYFAFHPNDKTAKECAVRFLQTFLRQAVAFRRRDASLLNIAPGICEINNLAEPSDAHWVHQLTAACRAEGGLNDEQSFVWQCLSAPLRAAAAGDLTVTVLLDDLQNAPAQLIAQLKEVYGRSTVPFILAGWRRFVLRQMQSGAAKLNNAEVLRLDRLPFAEAEILTEKLAEKYRVKINEQTRALIVRQFQSNALFIESILAAAREKNTDLENFQITERIYTDELFGGRIGRFYDDVFCDLASGFVAQRQLIELLYQGINSSRKKTTADIWREKSLLDEKEFSVLIDKLYIREIINFDAGTIYFDGADEVFKDYIEARYRLEILDEPRALVVGNALKKILNRAPQLMTRDYRRAAAIGFRELLAVFNCQKIPASLFDYDKFKKLGKKTGENEALPVKLPQIVFTTSGEAFYPPISRVADAERVAVALGFETPDYRRENEIAWIAAEIDSKLEAAENLTKFWCDRLEMLAVMCGFPNYQLWLVAPEGFAPAAIEVLRQRNVFGSSRKQLELLIKHLKIENLTAQKNDADEYEMILPMGDETEIIAAAAIEEIVKRHHFPPPEITKIKTAVIEAYINAAEHSLSPDRKIHQKLVVEDNKITITISNRGIKLPPEKINQSATPIEPDEGRRGWGLKLMRTLMDEVNFEQVDDGTRISMVKYLRQT